MRVFVEFCSFVKYFWRKSSLGHFPSPLEYSVDLMLLTPFYLFYITSFTTLAMYLIKITARSSFTQVRIIGPINRILQRLI